MPPINVQKTTSQTYPEQRTVASGTHRSPHYPTVLRTILPEIKPHLKTAHYDPLSAYDVENSRKANSPPYSLEETLRIRREDEDLQKAKDTLSVKRTE